MDAIEGTKQRDRHANIVTKRGGRERQRKGKNCKLGKAAKLLIRRCRERDSSDKNLKRQISIESNKESRRFTGLWDLCTHTHTHTATCIHVSTHVQRTYVCLFVCSLPITLRSTVPLPPSHSVPRALKFIIW